MHGCFVPVSLDNKQRMKVLLNLYASLEDYALKAFDFLLKNRSWINSELSNLLQLHEQNSDGKDKLLFEKVLCLARSLPDPFKAQENLKKLVTMFKDKSLFDLLKVATDIDNGCEQTKKAVVRSFVVILIQLLTPLLTGW